MGEQSMSFYIPLFIGFGGAIVGLAGSILTILIQSHYQNKRDTYRLAIEAAIQDYKSAFKAAGASRIAALPSYLYLHLRYMELIKAKKFSKEEVEKLTEEAKQLAGFEGNRQSEAES